MMKRDPVKELTSAFPDHAAKWRAVRWCLSIESTGVPLVSKDTTVLSSLSRTAACRASPLDML